MSFISFYLKKLAELPPQEPSNLGIGVNTGMAAADLSFTHNQVKGLLNRPPGTKFLHNNPITGKSLAPFGKPKPAVQSIGNMMQSAPNWTKGLFRAAGRGYGGFTGYGLADNAINTISDGTGTTGLTAVDDIIKNNPKMTKAVGTLAGATGVGTPVAITADLLTNMVAQPLIDRHYGMPQSQEPNKALSQITSAVSAANQGNPEHLTQLRETFKSNPELLSQLSSDIGNDQLASKATGSLNKAFQNLDEGVYNPKPQAPVNQPVDQSGGSGWDFSDFLPKLLSGVQKNPLLLALLSLFSGKGQAQQV